MWEVRVWPKAAVAVDGFVEKYTDFTFNSEADAISFARKKKAEGFRAGWRKVE